MHDEYELTEANPTVPFLHGPVQFIRTIISERYLIKNLVRGDLKTRYNKSYIGFGWTFLEPLLLSAVYYALFTIIAGRPEPLYALHVIIGVIVWGFFGKSLQSTVASLTKHGNLIKQVYFPREILVVSPVLSQARISLISLTAVIPVMLYLDVRPSINLLWMLPLGILLAALLALGIGMMVAPLNAISRDVEHLFRFIIRAGFFVSPVMWTYEMAHVRVSGGWLDVIMLNPMVVPITLVRNGIDNSAISFTNAYLFYSIVTSLVTVIIGMAIFKRWEAKVVKYL